MQGAVAATLLALMTSGIAPGVREARAGQAPPSGVVALDGSRVDVFGERRARAVALIFADPDCPVFRRALPRINRLFDDLSPRGVRVWLVYPDAAVPAIQQHVQEFGIRVPVVRDPAHQLVVHSGVTVTPEAALFDAGGALKYRGRIDDRQVSLGTTRPAPTREDLREAIVDLLDGRLASPRLAPAVGCYIDLAPRR